MTTCETKAVIISDGKALTEPFEVLSDFITARNVVDQSQVIDAIIVPSTFRGNVLTFQGSINGEDFYDLCNSYGNPCSVTVSKGAVSLVELDEVSLLPFIKIRAGSPSEPVEQIGDQSLMLILRSVR